MDDSEKKGDVKIEVFKGGREESYANELASKTTFSEEETMQKIHGLALGLSGLNRLIEDIDEIKKNRINGIDALQKILEFAKTSRESIEILKNTVDELTNTIEKILWLIDTEKIFHKYDILHLQENNEALKEKNSNFTKMMLGLCKAVHRIASNVNINQGEKLAKEINNVEEIEENIYSEIHYQWLARTSSVSVDIKEAIQKAHNAVEQQDKPGALKLLEDKIADCRTCIGELDKEITDIEGTIESIGEDNYFLKSYLKDFRSYKKELEDQIKLLENEIKKL